MRNLIALVGFAFALSACATKIPAPTTPPPTQILPPGVTAPPVLSPDQIRRAEGLRLEGMELLYSKDPLVKNEAKAKAKFEEAAQLGDPVSMDQLGGFYSSGTADTPKSCAKALEWFEKSAQGGYPLAVNNLAYTLVTCDDKKLRNSDRAEELVTFLYSANPSMVALLDTYAAVLAEQKNFKQAAKTLEVVIDIASLINANPERIDEMKTTLARYRNNKTLDESNSPEAPVFRKKPVKKSAL